MVLTHDLVQEGVAGAEVGGKDCVLISRATALHLQAAHPGTIIRANACCCPQWEDGLHRAHQAHLEDLALALLRNVALDLALLYNL